MVTMVVQKMTSPPCRAADPVSSTMLSHQQDKAAAIYIHNCKVLIRAGSCKICAHKCSSLSRLIWVQAQWSSKHGSESCTRMLQGHTTKMHSAAYFDLTMVYISCYD